ncbi:hypothetical protein AOLI_G00176570 [Acnodon oligacanthus]
MKSLEWRVSEAITPWCVPGRPSATWSCTSWLSTASSDHLPLSTLNRSAPLLTVDQPPTLSPPAGRLLVAIMALWLTVLPCVPKQDSLGGSLDGMIPQPTSSSFISGGKKEI